MTADLSPADGSEGGPVLGLLSRGLEFWIRQQCQAVEHLEVRLEGSGLQLLRGRLEGVRVEARGVLYQELALEEVELRGESLRVRMGTLLKRQILELENPFRVRGSIRFSGEGLNRSLGHANWSWLGDLLAEAVVGNRPLAALRFEEDRLVLSAQPLGGEDPVEGAARLRARGGTVEVCDLGGESKLELPMDPAIQVDTAQLEGGLLELGGSATIQP